MKKTITTFIPFGIDLGNGDIISKDCKFNVSVSMKIIESHRDSNGITIITKMEPTHGSFDFESVNNLKIYKKP